MDSRKSKRATRTSSSVASLRSTPAAKRKRKLHRALKKQKLEQEAIASTLEPDEEETEVRETMSAPILDVNEDKDNSDEDEKPKFFPVPIRMYETDDKGAIRHSKADLKEDDKLELSVYGSRIMMTPEGHVIGLEVRDDLMTNFNHKEMTTELCQCVEYEYEVSDSLKNEKSTRRKFMAKVLLFETVLRIPSFLWLFMQHKYDGLHDFLYQQTLLLFFMITILEGTRLASIRFSQIGRFEPCKTIITIITSIGYSLISSLLTALMQRFQVYFIEYRDHEDPVGILTLNIKLQNNNISYPYFFSLVILTASCFNLALAVILCVTNSVMNELENMFLLVIFFTACTTGSIYMVLIYYSGAFLTNPNSWDVCQITFSTIVSCKWAMWRFYMLQEVIRGRVMKVNEHNYQDVAVSFAF